MVAVLTKYHHGTDVGIDWERRGGGGGCKGGCARVCVQGGVHFVIKSMMPNLQYRSEVT